MKLNTSCKTLHDALGLGHADAVGGRISGFSLRDGFGGARRGGREAADAGSEHGASTLYFNTF